MPPAKEKGACKCGWLESAADDPKRPVEFDRELNEYHLVTGPKAYWMIYYCPLCGGSAPKSKRDRLFHTLTDVERRRLLRLTKEIRTVQDVVSKLGKPNIKQPEGWVTTKPERDGQPETTESYPVIIYTKLSDIADIHFTVYPADRVGISFRSKALKKKKRG